MENYKVILQMRNLIVMMEENHVAFEGVTFFRFKLYSLKLISVPEWTTVQILLQTRIAKSNNCLVKK